MRSFNEKMFQYTSRLLRWNVRYNAQNHIYGPSSGMNENRGPFHRIKLRNSIKSLKSRPSKLINKITKNNQTINFKFHRACVMNISSELWLAMCTCNCNLFLMGEWAVRRSFIHFNCVRPEIFSDVRSSRHGGWRTTSGVLYPETL